MPEKKKQHYVPQFYLRRFSYNDRQLGLYNLPTMTHVPNATVRHECYENYFYGEDSPLEDLFGYFEGETRQIFEVIDEHQMLPVKTADVHRMMAIYIILQSARTPEAVAEANELTHRLTKATVSAFLESNTANNMTPAEIAMMQNSLDNDRVQFSLKDAPQQAVQFNLRAWPLILDLRCALLINRAVPDFITSDNPVIKFNPFMSSIKNFSGTGLASKGLLLMFPISPRATLLLYDTRTYLVGDGNTEIFVTDPEDIRAINTLQVCSCSKKIYFKEENFNLPELVSTAAPHRRDQKVILRDIHQSQHEKIIEHRRVDATFVPRFSFIKMRGDAHQRRIKFQQRLNSRLPFPFEMRSPVTFVLYTMFIEEVVSKGRSIFDFFIFLHEDRAKQAIRRMLSSPLHARV